MLIFHIAYVEGIREVPLNGVPVGWSSLPVSTVKVIECGFIDSISADSREGTVRRIVSDALQVAFRHPEPSQHLLSYVKLYTLAKECHMALVTGTTKDGGKISEPHVKDLLDVVMRTKEIMNALRLERRKGSVRETMAMLTYDTSRSAQYSPENLLGPAVEAMVAGTPLGGQKEWPVWEGGYPWPAPS